MIGIFLSVNIWGTPAVYWALGSGGHLVGSEVATQVGAKGLSPESDLDKEKRRLRFEPLLVVWESVGLIVP